MIAEWVYPGCVVPQSTAAFVADELAAVREAITESTPTAGLVLSMCVECDRMYYKPKRDHRSYCPACGAARQFSAGQQMSGRFGPVYEKAVRRQLAYWTAEADRLGLKPGG